jgi:Domain of unknown function (DUF6438)
MKKQSRFWVIFPLILLSTQVRANNKIDSLKTDNEVVEFLKSVNDNFRSAKYDAIELRSSETIRKDQNCDGMADQWQVKNWEKADFNGDGLTDLLVTLYWYDYGVYVVMDKGNNQFDLLPLSYNVFDKCKLAKPITTNGRQLLLYYGKKDIPGKMVSDNKNMNQVDTLVYRHGDFVEFNRQPATAEIDSIEFHTGYCFGNCPVFKIRFDKNGHAEYIAGSYNPKEGKFSTVLKKKDLGEISDLINYIGVSNLRDNYSVSWTDDQTAGLRVRFADGSIKEIRDYGMRGTFGLRLLYTKFFALRTNQDWK